MTPQDFQTLIREARKEAGLTQGQLAEKVGVTQYTVTQFENGKQNLTIDTVCKMLTSLNVRLVPTNEERMQTLDQIVALAKTL